jgi:hypothetical protein
MDWNRPKISFGMNLESSKFRDWFVVVFEIDNFVSCPQLKGIFTNVGTRPLDPESALFSFTNLTSFSLIVRHGLGGSGKSQHVLFSPILTFFFHQSFSPPLKKSHQDFGT